ncbi:MAG: sugar transferase, partial [Frankiales bacterium]|nr:sugar transferase [Frankiales bacterium]
MHRSRTPETTATGEASAVPRVLSLRGRSGRGRLSDRTLLRYGVRPLLLLMDLLAWLFAVLPGGLVGRDVVLLALVVALYASAGLYRSRLSLSALDDLPALVARALAAAAVVLSLGSVLDMTLVEPGLLLTAGLLAVNSVLLRTFAYALVRRVRSRGWVAHPTLILGAGQIGGQIASSLIEHPAYGLHPVGFLDVIPLLAPELLVVPLLGGHES